MTYMHPFPRNARTSQAFGTNPGATLNGVRINPGGGHTGKDKAVPVGTPIHAAGDGVIDAARTFPNYSNEWLLGPMGGKTIILNCGDNAPSFVYAHCSRFTVVEGQRVKKGDVIGYSGNSGSASTGPHCHIEALPPRWRTFNGTYGRVNPDLYMTEYPDEIVIAPQAAIIEKEWDEMASKDDLKNAVREVLGEPEILDRIAIAILHRPAHLIDPSGTTSEIVGTTTLAKKINWLAHNDAQILNAIVEVSQKVSVTHPVIPDESSVETVELAQ